MSFMDIARSPHAAHYGGIDVTTAHINGDNDAFQIQFSSPSICLDSVHGDACVGFIRDCRGAPQLPHSPHHPRMVTPRF